MRKKRSEWSASVGETPSSKSGPTKKFNLTGGKIGLDPEERGVSRKRDCMNVAEKGESSWAILG